jgi:hypothetical protein
MSRHQLHSEAVAAVSPEEVWAVIADGLTWSEWGPWEETSREQDGSPDPAGVGAIRIMKSGRYTLREEVTAFEAPSHYAYRVLEGLPAKHYAADVRVTTDGTGSLITWDAQFESKFPVPGFLVARGLQKVIDGVTHDLAREAERRAGATEDLPRPSDLRPGRAGSDPEDGESPSGSGPAGRR